MTLKRSHNFNLLNNSKIKNNDMAQNYIIHSIFSLKPTAKIDLAQLNKSYKKLAIKYHPDKMNNNNLSSKSTMQMINKLKDLISINDNLVMYEKYGTEGLQQHLGNSCIIDWTEAEVIAEKIRDEVDGNKDQQPSSDETTKTGIRPIGRRFKTTKKRAFWNRPTPY